MNKEILSVFLGLLAIFMFVVPVIAEKGTSITYIKKADYLIPEWRFVGKDHNKIPMTGSIFQVLNSKQAGSIWEGDEISGDPVFTYFTTGKMMMNTVSGKQVWHFETVWTSISQDGGFKGRLNGKAGLDQLFTVQGVLQGFGDFKGQKLVVEAERQEPTSDGIAIFRGVLIIP